MGNAAGLDPEKGTCRDRGRFAASRGSVLKKREYEINEMNENYRVFVHIVNFVVSLHSKLKRSNMPEEQFLAGNAQVVEIMDVISITIDVVKNDAARRRPLN